MLRFEIRRSTSSFQPYYCRAVSIGNNAVLMTSETYRAKQDAINVANLMKRDSGSGTVVDLS